MVSRVLKILPKNQLSFARQNGNIEAISTIMLIIRDFSQEELVLAVCVDIKQGYYIVEISKFMDRMSQIRISGEIINIVINLLMNKHIFV